MNTKPKVIQIVWHGAKPSMKCGANLNTATIPVIVQVCIQRLFGAFGNFKDDPCLFCITGIQNGMLETSIYEQEQALEQLKQQRDYLASYDNIGEMAITISYSPW